MLTVDSREPPALQQAVLKRAKEEVHVEKMVAGDFRIVHGDTSLLIERKAVSDLISTWVTGEQDGEGGKISRLRRQLHSCRDTATYAALLVEGDFSEDPTTGMVLAGGRLRQVRYQGLVRLLWDLQDEGIRLLHTATREQTAQLVVALHESFRRAHGAVTVG